MASYLKFQTLEMSISPQDHILLTRQLGHPPRGILEVVARSSKGHPRVVKMAPVIENRPFPTLFWLTCPKLKKEISHFEEKGYIKRWEKDKKLMARLKDDHERYRQMRFALVQAQETFLPENQLTALKNTGVGGTRLFSSIKCLHAHYAHYLADGNVVGEKLHRALMCAFEKGNGHP